MTHGDAIDLVKRLQIDAAIVPDVTMKEIRRLMTNCYKAAVCIEALVAEVGRLSHTLANCRNAHIADMESYKTAERVIEVAREVLQLTDHPVTEPLLRAINAYDEAKS